VTTTDSAFVDSEQDLSEVLSFLSETYGSFHSLRNWSLTRMGDWRYGGNHRFIKTDPDFFSRNMHVWREGPKIIGLAISERGEEMTVQVGPDERRLEESMLGWVEDQWGREKGRIAVTVLANDVWRQNILEKRGYRMAESRGFLRRYDTLLSPHQASLENGFSLSDLERSKDADGLIDLISIAFANPSIDREWYESKHRAPGFQPSMCVQVLSPQGRCVSCAEARIDWKRNYAEIDLIATHPEYQRRGLSRACLAEMFKRLADMRVRDAYIGSVAEPAPSNRLFDSMLPIEKVEAISWELKR